MASRSGEVPTRSRTRARPISQCCGALIGRDGAVARLRCQHDRRGPATRFMRPSTTARRRLARPMGPTCWLHHSHPDHPASHRIATRPRLAFFSYVIVSGQNGEPGAALMAAARDRHNSTGIHCQSRSHSDPLRPFWQSRRRRARSLQVGELLTI
jgi:hypothetical protein